MLSDSRPLPASLLAADRARRSGLRPDQYGRFIVEALSELRAVSGLAASTPVERGAVSVLVAQRREAIRAQAWTLAAYLREAGDECGRLLILRELAAL